ncbi:unnamed protein product [Sphagnum jensenii]|uniref:Uncharacterized protein n=1 Tax=Sphagnum jensenii TaxID=128206 RepID=A0ABP1AB62_9BRYO
MKEEEPECNFEKLCPTLSNRAAGRGRLQCCLISIVLNATVDTSSGARPCSDDELLQQQLAARRRRSKSVPLSTVAAAATTMRTC